MHSGYYAASASLEPSVPFDPLTVAWEHAYWAEGTEFVALGLADNDPVASWPDEPGSNPLTQATGSLQPIYDAAHASFNNKPVVSAPSGHRLRGAFSAAISQPWTVVVVGIHALTTSFATLFDNSSALAAATVYRNNNTTGRLLEAGAGLSSGTIGAGPDLIVAYGNGGSSAVEINGSGVSSGNAGTNALDGLTVFANRNTSPSSATYCVGPIAFIGVYDGDARSDPAWADFEQWVEDHYGITIA